MIRPAIQSCCWESMIRMLLLLLLGDFESALILLLLLGKYDSACHPELLLEEYDSHVATAVVG